MKIAAIEAIPYSIPYLHPLHFASGSVHEADHVLVRLRTDDGVVGTADTPPRPYTYGETQKSIVAVVEDIFAPQLIGVDIFDREKVQAILDRHRPQPDRQGRRGHRPVGRHRQDPRSAGDKTAGRVHRLAAGLPHARLQAGPGVAGLGPGVPRDLRHQHVQAQDRPAPPPPRRRGRPGAARRPGRGRRALHGRQPRLVRQRGRRGAAPHGRPGPAVPRGARRRPRGPRPPPPRGAAPRSPSPPTSPPRTSGRPPGKSSPAARTSWR